MRIFRPCQFISGLIVLNSHSVILLQMGVSAIFVSALAQSRLAVPQTPPLSQQDLLATALQPIISFVVLGSILIRILNIFYFRERLFMCALS
jgi:hypothetical protein